MKLMLQENVTYEDVENAPKSVVLNMNLVMNSAPREQIIALAQFFTDMGRMQSATVIRSIMIPFMQGGAEVRVEVERNIRKRSYYFNIGLNMPTVIRAATPAQRAEAEATITHTPTALPEPEPKPKRGTMRRILGR
jgi:hypothetical protein